MNDPRTSQITMPGEKVGGGIFGLAKGMMGDEVGFGQDGTNPRASNDTSEKPGGV